MRRKAAVRMILIGAGLGLGYVAPLAGMGMHAAAIGGRFAPIMPERRDLARHRFAAERTGPGLLARLGAGRLGYGRPLFKVVFLHNNIKRAGAVAVDRNAEIIGLSGGQFLCDPEIAVLTGVVIVCQLRSVGVIEIPDRILAAGGIHRVDTGSIWEDLKIHVPSPGRQSCLRFLPENKLRRVFHVFLRDRACRRDPDAQRHEQRKQNSYRFSPHHRILLVD